MDPCPQSITYYSFSNIATGKGLLILYLSLLGVCSFFVVSLESCFYKAQNLRMQMAQTVKSSLDSTSEDAAFFYLYSTFGKIKALQQTKPKLPPIPQQAILFQEHDALQHHQTFLTFKLNEHEINVVLTKH
ncbi:hypothetical protein FKM82_012203 [Ascaphus truei]